MDSNTIYFATLNADPNVRSFRANAEHCRTAIAAGNTAAAANAATLAHAVLAAWVRARRWRGDGRLMPVACEMLRAAAAAYEAEQTSGRAAMVLDLLHECSSAIGRVRPVRVL